jgi:hypothetical protein
MWVLGGLGSLCGVCLGSVFWILPIDQLLTQVRSSLTQEQLNQLGGFDLGQLLRGVYTAMGVFVLLISISILVLAGFVRKGLRGATITALVIYLLIAIACGLGVLVCVVEAVTVMPPAAIAALLWLAVGSVAGLTIFWLVQSLRNVGPMKQRYEMERANLLRQIGQPTPGYGYGTPPNWPQQTLGPLPPPPQKSETPPPSPPSQP